MNKEIKIKVKGIKGDTPTDEQLVELIKPLIPEPLKGDIGPKGETPTDKYLVTLITPLIPEPKNGETPTDDRLIKLIKPLIVLPEIKEQIEETPNTLVTKVNKSDLKIEKDIIDVDWEEYKNKETTIEDVKNLPETIRHLQHRVASYNQVAGGGTSVSLKTNGVPNPVQTELNLKQGANITLTGDGVGGVTIASVGGGGTTWGTITGALSAQTDLQTALNTKWNTDGSSGPASGNWDLGGVIITDVFAVPAIDFDQRSLKDNSGIATVDWNNKKLSSLSVVTIDWSGLLLTDTTNNVSLDWGNKILRNNIGASAYNWDLNYMYAFNITNHVVIDISTQRLLDIADNTSISWTSRDLYSNDGGTILANYANVTGMRFKPKIFVGSNLTTAPVSAIHVDSGSAIASELRFTAGTTTGQTATDGFQVGVTNTGIAEIRQRENLGLDVYTNNALAMAISSTGNVGIGTSPASARLHAVSITEQFRLGYNVSNYMNVILNSTGSPTFALVGTAPEFYFSNPVNVPYEIYGAGWNGNLEVPTKDAVYDQIEVKANLASPTFTGTPTLPTGTIGVTQTAGNNTTAVATTAFVTAINNNSSYRTILQASGSHTAARVAGTYGMSVANPIAISGTGTLYPLAVIQIVSADYPTVNGITTKLRIRAQLYTNDVAPTGNYTFGLYPITRPAVSGGAGLAIYTLGTVVVGSNGATFVAPAVDLLGSAVGADFALPADGAYVIGIVTTATVAASAHVHVNAQLQIRNT